MTNIKIKAHFSQNKLLVLMLILLSTAPTFLLNERNMNVALIMLQAFSPLLLLKYPQTSNSESYLWAFVITFLLDIILFNYDTIRWSTVLYSVSFIILFIAYSRILKATHPHIITFIILLKCILIAYFVVLVIQQICVITGLPIFNVRQYNPSEPFKLNSLMSEPSHSARIVPILMYIYVSLKEKFVGRTSLLDSIKSDKIVWFAFLYSCVTMMSATAYLFMMFVFAKFLDLKQLKNMLFIIFVFIAILSLTGVNKTLQRTIDITEATLTLDEYKIMEADGSGSYRIVPTIRGAQAIDFFSYKNWVGHGVDADIRDIEPMPGTDIGCAGSFMMWYNFGIIVQIFYWMVTFHLCYIKNNKASILVWLLCVWLYGGMNNQIIWTCICLLYTYKYYNNIYRVSLQSC